MVSQTHASNKRALLIGVNDYDFLGGLSYARRDAEHFSAALQNSLGFESDDIKLMSCSARGGQRAQGRYIEEVVSALTDLPPLELLVFGFWGHGFYSVDGTVYLCGYDAREDNLQRSAVSLSFVQAKLAQVGATETLMILDCCQARTVGRGGANTLAPGAEMQFAKAARLVQLDNARERPDMVPSTAILTSCKETESAYEWEDRCHGIFTAHLLDGMDAGITSTAELATYVSERVPWTARALYRQPQTPWYRFEGRGDIDLDRRATVAPDAAASAETEAADDRGLLGDWRQRKHYSVPDVGAVQARDKLRESLNGYAQPLELDPTAPPLTAHATRRNMFLRPVNWRNVCRGGYAERAILKKKLIPAFNQFLTSGEHIIEGLQLPVFWIGGRSGDGKSVLLLQLCQAAKETGWDQIFANFNSPDDFVNWVEATQLEQPSTTDVPLVVSVVDDLHKASDWGRIQDVLERAATNAARVAVLTCGPTPERTFFRQGTELFLNITTCDTKSMSDEDMAVIGAHLGIDLTERADTRATLVEKIFLNLSLGANITIKSFAHSLRKRVDSRVGRTGLFEQLTAMTWLDLPMPTDSLYEDDVQWLEALGDETQLHVDQKADGFRFGHPAIAKPIFEELTKDEHREKSLTTRIADTLLGVVADYDSHLAITRALRQLSARLSAERDINETEALRRILTKAGNQKIAAATAVYVIYLMNQSKEQIEPKLRNLARTFRESKNVEPYTRAFLARNLALAPDAEEKDLRAALLLTRDPEASRHMGGFLISASSKAFFNNGWMFEAMPDAMDWVRTHADRSEAQHIVVAHLSSFPQHVRVRWTAQNLFERTELHRLPSSSIAVVAKYLEEEVEDRVHKWLMLKAHEPQCVDVLVALLKKRGDKWNDVAEKIVGQRFVEDNDDWINGVAMLLPHMESEAFVERAKEIAGVSPGDPKRAHLFKSLAAKIRDFDTQDLVRERLDILWQQGACEEAYSLLASGWSNLGGSDPASPERAQAMFERCSELERSEATGAELKALHHSLKTLLQTGHHAHCYAEHALAFMYDRPNSPLRGAIAGRLLAFTTNAAALEADAFIGELKQREEALTVICWDYARRKGQAASTDRIICTKALMSARWEAEPEKIRELIKGFWYPNVIYGANSVLHAWLKDERCADEAWHFLLDPTIQAAKIATARASVVSGSLDLAFRRLREGPLEIQERQRMLKCLQAGVGNYETNPAAAWAALQRRAQWPADAEGFLWRGILRSAIEGFTLRREDFWSEFSAWQATTKDIECHNILANHELSLAL